MPLTARDIAVLDFERQWRHLPGSKHENIRARLLISPSHYYELLNALLDSPEAAAYDPLTVKRVQRVRESRRRSSFEGRRADPRSR